MSSSRRLWTLLEAYHAVVYFAPEVREAFEAVGLRGFWRGYFAGRAAPMGAVGPGVVTATFFGFHPEFVARALPEVWSTAAPPVALETRLAGVDAALRRLGTADRADECGHAAELVREAMDGCSPAGRPLFAANARLDWPDAPHLALWHAATLVREHRGDGHVAALVGAELDGCEAHVTRSAADGTSPESIRPHRGWSEHDWHAAIERLTARGWLDETGTLTAHGHERRNAIEDHTDGLAREPVESLGERLEPLLELLQPLVATLEANAVIPYPNPMGLPPSA